MKRVPILLALLFAFSLAFTSCRENKTIADDVEDVADDVEDAVD